MPMNFPMMLKKHARYETEHVQEFLRLFDEKYRAEMEDLLTQAGDEDEGIEFYADEAWIPSELRTLSSHLAVVALYRVVEFNVDKILRWRWAKSLIQKKELYRADRLKKWLWDELRVDLESLPGHESIRELRLANNALKHEGNVTSALANYPGWNEGEGLADLDRLFDRTVPKVEEYLFALAKVVIPSDATRGRDQRTPGGVEESA